MTFSKSREPVIKLTERVCSKSVTKVSERSYLQSKGIQPDFTLPKRGLVKLIKVNFVVKSYHVHSFMFQPSFHSSGLSTLIIRVINGSLVLTFPYLINDIGMVHFLSPAVLCSLHVNFILFVFNTHQVVLHSWQVFLGVQTPELLFVVSFKIVWSTSYNWENFFRFYFFLIWAVIIEYVLNQVYVDILFSTFVDWFSIKWARAVTTFPNFDQLLGSWVQGNFLVEVSVSYFRGSDAWVG